MGDLERLLARITASSGVGYGRDAENVVLYEDAAKRRLLALHSAICALQALKVLIMNPFACLCGSVLVRARDSVALTIGGKGVWRAYLF